MLHDIIRWDKILYDTIRYDMIWYEKSVHDVTWWDMMEERNKEKKKWNE